MSRKSFITVFISVLLVLGFLGTSVISYLVANEALNEHVRDETLVLTSENIYSEVQRDVLQPILVSSLMAHDSFVQEWIEGGEQQPQRIIRYLQAIQDRYQAVTAFYVSGNTLNYYHSSGILRKVAQDNPQDDWFFRVAQLDSDYQVNLGVDTADAMRTTFFVNHKIIGSQGQYLGAIGVGIASNSLQGLIDSYQQRFDSQIYFVDREGRVALSGAKYSGNSNIRSTPGITDIAARVLTTPEGIYSFLRDDDFVFLSARWIPELNWYLLVEQQQLAEKSVRNILWINLSISAVITLIVVGLIYLVVGRYQGRLEHASNTDYLTGTASRHAFEPLFKQMLSLAKRNKQSISALLLDLDDFKAINDRYGHQQGDRVLQKAADLMKGQLRRSDVICRWAGEEFLILLPECDLKGAQALAQKVRLSLEESLKVIDGFPMGGTASVGVAQYNHFESSNHFFSRLDSALSEAKSRGANQVVLAAPAEQSH